MDELYAPYYLHVRSSDMFRGAIFASKLECRSNPDWMAQAAHSAREVLYPLISEEKNEDNLIKLFRKYATRHYDSSSTSNQEFKGTFVELDTIYGKLSDLAHHGTAPKTLTAKEIASFSDKDFEKLIDEYINLLARVLRLQQVYVHTVIDELVNARRKKDLKFILDVNLDARQYFYFRADEWWLDCLWNEGFLDGIKEKTEGPNVYEYRTPELNYLERMADQCPAKVVNMIMLNLQIAADTSNPAVAYAFLRICSSLPANQLARMVDKIRDERWIPQIDAIHRFSSFESMEMLKTLADADDPKSLLVLAEAVLAVRPSEELTDGRFVKDNPFYLEYLARAGIFAQLASLPTEYAEGALALAIRKLSDVLAISNEFGLFEVDFFTLQLGQADTWQVEVRELAAVVKTLAVPLIGKRCDDAQTARDIYGRHFASLPDNRVMRRLAFFVLSLCPAAFKDYLKQAYFSLFEADNYYDVSSGTEYKKALRKGFHVLSTEDKKSYVEGILETFGRQVDRKRVGSLILSMTLPHLDEMPALRKRVEKEGFVLDPDYEPRPDRDTEDGEGHYVTSQAPVSDKEFGQLPIAQIAKKLRNEWTPAELNARNTADDFYSPTNAEGVGVRLQSDMPERLQEYAENATIFFERDALDPHYTYAFLNGMREAIKNHSDVASEINWDAVFSLCCAIKGSGEKDPFPREERQRSLHDNWLANWDAVHSALAGTLRELLTEKDGIGPVDIGSYRDRVLGTVSYLLAYPDPSPSDEQFDVPGSALDIRTMRNDADGKWAANPFYNAINSVRGRAFEAFLCFVMLDAEELRSDVKEMYEGVLQRENTRALMFMFGRYFSIFYFRDKDWTRKLLPQIFPQDPVKKWLYSAAWEGYLAARLYGDMISDPAIQALYLRALDLTDSDYPRGQRHFKDPAKGIAEHLALAFMHYYEFGLDHPLLKAFWENDNPKQHAHFVQSLGRFFISSENSEGFFANNPESKSRLRVFWDWLLKEQEEQSVFMQFGLWINLEKSIFDPFWLAQRVKQTLEKTNGLLDWQHELIKSAPQLAQAAPEETLAIARLYLREGGVHGNEQRTLWHWDSDKKWLEAFEILYRCQTTQLETTALINQLVGEGGRAFWKLKKILVENP